MVGMSRAALLCPLYSTRKIQAMKITFIGLGKMGTAMVERLLQAGYQVTIFNRTLSKTKLLVAKGAIFSSSIKEAVKNANVVMTSLLNDKAVLEVTAELLQHIQPGTIHIGLSTILPDTAKSLETKHQEYNTYYISAAVLGIPNVARERGLTTFCAGSAAEIEKILPLLQTFSQNIVPLGSQIFAPNVMKICMNYSLATTIELISELYIFAEKSGLDTEVVRKGLHQIYGHPAFKRYIDKIHERNFAEVNFDMVGGNKDMNLFQEAFSSVGVVPEIGNVVRARFIAALAQGMEGKDWSAIYEIVRAQSGLV
jgi:3-hydroxyisobutyrate dehydrogenase-like beta-hydroxyacid dehydrogenase